MTFDLPLGGMELPSPRSFLNVTLPNSFLEKLGARLFEDGSLLQGARWRKSQFTNLRNQVDEKFVDQRVLAFTPELTERDLSIASFFGGVCALSTRESSLLKKDEGWIEDPVTGERYEAIDAFKLNLPTVVTALQIFEAIGCTRNRAVIVLEDQLWSERIIEFLGIDDEILEAEVREVVSNRNSETGLAIENLRSFLYGNEAKELVQFRDVEVMKALRAGTFEMFDEVGISLPEDSDYPLVYAGMYSYVWREIMINLGVMDQDDLMVIFEPEKHIVAENSRDNTMAFFREKLLEKQPYMQPGSKNENIGIIAYANSYIGTKAMRNYVPTALVPNSANFTQFDFTEFPKVPDNIDELPLAKEFDFYSNIGNTKLTENPAFLWGNIYPPTERSTELMYLMDDLRQRTSFARSMEQKRAGNVPMGQRMKAITREAEIKMTQYSLLLIEELQNMNEAMFGDQNENR